MERGAPPRRRRVPSHKKRRCLPLTVFRNSMDAITTILVIGGLQRGSMRDL